MNSSTSCFEASVSLHQRKAQQEKYRPISHINKDAKMLKNPGTLISVILATQEAEIRRIAVQSQPGEIVLETLS
jgi:hypothetical protein